MNNLKFKLKDFLFFLIFIFSFQIFAQTTYYVSPTGNEANNGSEANPWLTIQGAINNSSVVNGDIIIVKDGTYNENITVSKEITIQSENGCTTTTVTAADYHYDAFKITANNVTIDGFTISGANYRWNYVAGIEILNVNNCTISNSNCYNNLSAVKLHGADNNTISNNHLNSNGWFGILLESGSDNNLILNNEINNNTNNGGSYPASGIQNGENSISNTVRGNTIENNEQYGVSIYTNSDITLGNNDINDKGNNIIKNNGVYDVYNGSTTSINAYYNNWGTNDSTIIDTHIYDNDENENVGEVYFDPFNHAVVNTFYVSTTGNDANDGSEANPWLTIQGAIDNNSVGNQDIILVKKGIYTENVTVTKEITLQSENGNTETTIIAADYHYSAINITANYVTINGFTIYGSTSTYYTNNLASIYLGSVNNCTISNNRCGLDDSYGHNSYRSIFLRNSDNNLISNNICIYSAWEGILLYEGSDNNDIRNNTCRYNNWGISNASTDNIFRNNICEDNTKYGIYLTSGTANLGNNDENDKGGNTFRNNGLYDVYNETETATNAYYNYWGSTETNTIDSHIYDNDENISYGEVYFDPWLDTSPLPVELITFTASVKNNSVLLNWETATEVNNYGFNVERKPETGNWKKIVFIEGQGNSNSPKLYSFEDNSVTASGKYFYRLKQIDIDGQFKYSKTIEINSAPPSKFELEQNYPNPFNPITTIKYQIPEHVRNDKVVIKIYDVLGNEIKTLVNQIKEPGIYEVKFNGNKYASGIYYYRISAGNFVQTKKMILMK